MKVSELLKKLFAPKERGPAHPRPQPRFAVPVEAGALANIFAACADFETRQVFLGGDARRPVTVCYIDGLVSGADVSRDVLRPLTDRGRFGALDYGAALSLLVGGGVYSYSVKRRESMDDVVRDIVNGYCAVLLCGVAVTFETKTGEKRSISPPQTEKALKGGKDAFVETLRTNTSLVRRKLRNPELKIEEITVGRQTLTKVAVVYMEGLTNPELARELKRRVSRMDVEGVVTTAELEEYVVDNVKSPFPQLLTTERTDRFCLNLLEGRAGLLVDGLPIGFMAPGTFAQFLKVPEDSANHWLTASALTLLRYLALFLALVLPGLYVAVAMYHQEMLPTQLMLSVIESKQKVPFPTAAEVLGMLLTFELLQEAGLRLPQPLGETIGIIGALIVGQSAVEANVISPVVVIIVALAGIMGYMTPNQDLAAALRLCRFLMTILSALGGLFGLTIGCAVLTYHLCTLESFGAAYMTPFAGADGRELSRALLRRPLKYSKYREEALKVENHRNQK